MANKGKKVKFIAEPETGSMITDQVSLNREGEMGINDPSEMATPLLEGQTVSAVKFDDDDGY